MSVYTDLLHFLCVALMTLQKKKKIKAERKFRATAMGTGP